MPQKKLLEPVGLGLRVILKRGQLRDGLNSLEPLPTTQRAK
jgi:hypothetical protein